MPSHDSDYYVTFLSSELCSLVVLGYVTKPISESQFEVMFPRISYAIKYYNSQGTMSKKEGIQHGELNKGIIFNM